MEANVIRLNSGAAITEPLYKNRQFEFYLRILRI
jgi:hypothetical protein